MLLCLAAPAARVVRSARRLVATDRSRRRQLSIVSLIWIIERHAGERACGHAGHTHSVLPTLRTIESCNQNLSMALVNQTFPFRTSRLGEYQHDAIVAVQENAKTQGHDVRGAEPDRASKIVLSAMRPPAMSRAAPERGRRWRENLCCRAPLPAIDSEFV
jgi:hypothetical protein